MRKILNRYGMTLVHIAVYTMLGASIVTSIFLLPGREEIVYAPEQSEPITKEIDPFTNEPFELLSYDPEFSQTRDTRRGLVRQ